MRRAAHRGAYTLVEVLVGLALGALVLGIIYGLFHFFFFSRSRSNLTGLTRRSFIQKDAHAGVRRLTYRLREATQILGPPPGTTSDELVFRDIENVDIRLRRIAAENRVVTERSVNGAWERETRPVNVATGAGQLPVSFPVDVLNCPSIRFTVISAGSVVVEASIESEGTLGSLLTLVKLRNVNRAD